MRWRKIVALAMLALMAFPSFGMVLGTASLTVITVKTDSESYEPDEKVEISGTVDVNGTADVNASVTILVVFNSTTIYTNVTDTDEDGEFYTEFQLSENASEGLYNVTASTDGVEAKTNFTVVPDEDDLIPDEEGEKGSGKKGGKDDEGAASPSVETDSESYEPGEYVEISGVADANASVLIVVVVNSTLETIYDNVIEADEDGEFSVMFQLLEEAPEGLYNVTASTDEVEAETYFTVSIDGDDGDDDEGTDDEGSVKEDAERAIGLKVAIDRAIVFKQKIDDIITRLTDNGFEIQAMAEIQTSLNNAGLLLDESLDILNNAESYDANIIAQNLATARGILGRTWGHLHNTAKSEVKAWKTEKYIQNMENHIQSLEAKINRLQDRLERGKVVLSALQAQRRQLIRIRERLAAGDVEGAVDDLDNMIEVIDEEIADLNGEGTSVKLKSMNRIEAKIRVLNATVERLSRKGEDTSVIEEELANATALLSQIMELLESGDVEGTEELLEEAEESLERISETIRSIMFSSSAEKGRPNWEQEG